MNGWFGFVFDCGCCDNEHTLSVSRVLCIHHMDAVHKKKNLVQIELISHQWLPRKEVMDS